MNYEDYLPLSNMSYEGLRFFHSLSNWVAQYKKPKPHLKEWKQGQKHLTKLKCIKPPQKKPANIPSELPENTLYVPTSSSGLTVIIQLRNAFCHNNIKYDETRNEFEIAKTKHVSIAGRFSLDAIIEFISVYLDSTNNTKKQKKSK